MKEHSVGKITVLAAIKGLVSEGEAVRKKASENPPDIAAISLSPEELLGLRKYISEGEFDIGLYAYEEAYLANLRTFGEVRAPAPCYVEFLKVADRLGIPLVPLDMNDDEFADTYIENVSGMDFIGHMMRERRLERKNFRVRDVEDFIIQWDRFISRNRGLRAVERAREEYMGKKLASLSGKGRVLAMVDFERAEGVVRAMAKYL